MAASEGAIEVGLRRDAAAARPSVAYGRGRRSKWWRDIGWRHVVGVAALAFALFPVIWVFSASVNPTNTLAGQRLIPANPSLENYRHLLLGEVPFRAWFLNTVMIASSAAAVSVFFCALGAYAFSRLRFAGRRAGLMALLLVQMFPQLLAMVAIFLFMLNVRDVYPAFGLGSRLGLVLVYLAGALGINTWLMKGFFDTIPKDLDESAKVDGASHSQVFFLVILPLAAPILAVIALLSFVIAINEFVLASILLQDESQYTLAVGLFRYVGGERFSARWGPFAAGTIMGGVPVIVLWMFLQRYIVSGLTGGAVKG
jgi:arabinogalactan oligomer / maltooligosaccharide transport system permease protein